MSAASVIKYEAFSLLSLKTLQEMSIIQMMKAHSDSVMNKASMHSPSTTEDYSKTIQQREEQAIMQFAVLSAKVTLRMVERRWRKVARQQNASLLRQQQQQLKQLETEQYHHHGQNHFQQPSTSHSASSSGMISPPVSPPSHVMNHPPSDFDGRHSFTNTPNRSNLPSSTNPSSAEQVSAIKAKTALQLQSEKLPSDYIQYYTQLLESIVLNSLTVIRPPPETLLLGLYFVSKLVAVKTLPESLATPTRLLLAGLVLADVILSDEGAVPAKIWVWIADNSRVEKYVGMSIPAMKKDALVALNFNVHVSFEEWNGWVEFIKSAASS
jgi:hypothetical protein